MKPYRCTTTQIVERSKFETILKSLEVSMAAEGTVRTYEYSRVFPLHPTSCEANNFSTTRSLSWKVLQSIRAKNGTSMITF